MSFSVTDDNKGIQTVMEGYVDFQTESNYEMYEGDSFDNLIHIINDSLPDLIYIDDGFPEPIRFIDSDEGINPAEIIQAPMLDDE